MRNLGISRELARIIAVVAFLATLVTLAIFAPNSMQTVMLTLGPAVLGLLTALKATEAADTAAKTQNTAAQVKEIAEFTVSKQAMLEQAVVAHCGEICPRVNCPLRKRDAL